MLAPEFIPVWGGVGTYIIELIRSLPRNIEVHVVTPVREGFGAEKTTTFGSNLSEYLKRDIHLNFICKASDTFAYNAKFQYACSKYVPKLLKEEHIDLIHSHTAHMPDLLLRLNKRVPTVTTVHTTIQGQREGTRNSGMNFWDWEFSEKMTLLSYPFLRLAEYVYFLKDSFYITPSNWMRNHMRKKYSSLNSREIFVIPHGVDTELFSPSDRKKGQDERVVLFVGRLIALKGIQYLTRSMPSILKEHPGTLFIFIGSGNINACIKELENLKVPKDNYLFLGYKDRASLPKYYRNADLLVLPSLQENFPFTLLEAMACGVPSIVSDVGGSSEIVENNVNGLLIKRGSVKDIADAVIYLLDNPSVLEKVGREARKTVEQRFSSNIMALNTSSVYEQIINEKTIEPSKNF